MPRIREIHTWAGVSIVRFDQCVTGLDTTKPTQLCVEGMDLSAMKDKRCNHERKTWTRDDGTKFQAAHRSTVQRWEKVDGKMQRASKAQGEYTPLFSKIVAVAVHKNVSRTWKQEELTTETL